MLIENSFTRWLKSKDEAVYNYAQAIASNKAGLNEELTYRYFELRREYYDI